MFYEIRGGVGEGMNGLAPITWVDLDAYARRTGVDLDAVESRAILMLDRAYRFPDPAPAGNR